MCACVRERERPEQGVNVLLIASLARSSGQPWPAERQQRRELEKVAAAPTSSRALVGSPEREGGSGPAAMLAHRGGNS